jgi:transcriptional regulator with XRE-family HTH domain
MTVRFDFGLMQRDAAAKGWNGSQLAERAGVSQMTVSRFFRGGTIRPGTAAKLARAIGRPVERYIVSSIHEGAAAS